jgi:hypothetical protein
VAKLLLKHGVQQNYKDEDGTYPLTIARIYGQMKIVEILEAKNVWYLSASGSRATITKRSASSVREGIVDTQPALTSKCYEKFLYVRFVRG